MKTGTGIVLRLARREDVREMMRISDARMSGTSYGACILHVSPEAAVGGPLALVPVFGGAYAQPFAYARSVNHWHPAR